MAKFTSKMANGVDPDQTAPFWSSLIRSTQFAQLFTSVPIFKAICLFSLCSSLTLSPLMS